MGTENIKVENLKHIYKRWQNMELVTKEEYKDTGLSQEDKKILCDLGLPENPLKSLSFDLKEIDDIWLDKEHIVIGNDYGTKLCINKNNEVVSVDAEGEYPTRFVNTSLSRFLQCIEIYDSYEARFENISDEEVGAIMDEMRTKFHQVDKQALSGEENWWSVILEQVELGVM